MNLRVLILIGLLAVSLKTLPAQTHSFELATSRPYGMQKYRAERVFLFDHRSGFAAAYSEDGLDYEVHVMGDRPGDAPAQLGRPRDFTVLTDGTMILSGLSSQENEVFTYLLSYDAQGTLLGSKRLSELVDVNRLASDSQNRVFALGRGPRLIQRSRNIHEDQSSGSQTGYLMHQLDPQSGTVIARDCPVPLPGNREEMARLQELVGKSPFAVDGLGRKYFQGRAGEVHVVDGGQIVPIAVPRGDEFRWLSALTVTSKGVLVQTVEGRASSGNPALVHNPARRTFLIESSSLSLDEVELPPEVGIVHGENQAGQLVSVSAGSRKVRVRIGFEARSK